MFYLNFDNILQYFKLDNNMFQAKVSKCEKCKACIVDSPNILADIAHPLENRIDPMLHRVQERVRELELELAQTKLAHVEAECRNQVIDKNIFCVTSIFKIRYLIYIKINIKLFNRI